jgi:hypothetical protein
MSVKERQRTPIVFYPEIVINIKENSITTIIKELPLFLLGVRDHKIDRRIEGYLIANTYAVINIVEPFSAKKIGVRAYMQKL